MSDAAVFVRCLVKLAEGDSAGLQLSGRFEGSSVLPLLVAGLGTGLPMAYGAMTAPKGRRLHGAGSTAAQTSSALTGAGLGGLAGGFGGAGVSAMAGADPKTQAIATILSALGGAGLGGYAGQQVGQAFHPGPRQLGLGDREEGPQTKAASFVSYLLSVGDAGLEDLTTVKTAGFTDWYDIPALRSRNLPAPTAADRTAATPKAPGVMDRQRMLSAQEKLLEAQGTADRLKDVESQAKIDRDLPAPRGLPPAYEKPVVNIPEGGRQFVPRSVASPVVSHASPGVAPAGSPTAAESLAGVLGGSGKLASPGAATVAPALSSALSPPTGMSQVPAPTAPPSDAIPGGYDTMHGMYDSWKNLTPEMRGGIGAGAAGLGLYGLYRLLNSGQQRKQQDHEEDRSAPMSMLPYQQPQLMLPGPQQQTPRIMMVG